MNLDRYGLSYPPFGGRGPAAFAAVPSRLVPLEELQQSLLDGQGIAVLTATAGLGKTALCRELELRLQDDWLVVLLREAGYTTRRSLLQAMLYELGLPYTGLTEQEARLRLLQSIRDRQPDKAGLLLLVDEAQRLNDRLLEELRSLINHEQDGRPLVRLLLCGDLVLEERLIDPALASINQRVVSHVSLAPLSHEESAQLIDDRLVQAGGDGWEHVLTRTAMELLCLVCDGSPRNLEQLAKRSLQIAAEQREPRVSVDSVRRALEELKELPLQWNEPSNLDAYTARETPAAEPHEEAEALEFADDDLALLDADDAVTVQVGDELPATNWDEPAVAAYAIEVGEATWPTSHGLSATPTEAAAALDPLFTRRTSAEHVLFDDLPATLEDTAVLYRGPAALSSTEPVSGPDVRASTSPGESTRQPTLKLHSAVPAAVTSGWTEQDLADPYAALDAVHTPAIPASPRTASIVPATVELPPRLVTQPAESLTADTPLHDHPATPEYEEELLAEVRDIASQVWASVAGRDAASTPSPTVPTTLESSPWCAGISTMPEWDVVQPEWLAERPYTPVEIDTSHQLELELATARDKVESNAPAVDAGDCRLSDDGASDLASTDPWHVVDAVAASTTPVPAPTSVQLRTDDAGQRPYSQLFSRLRRLRSSFVQRSGTPG